MKLQATSERFADPQSTKAKETLTLFSSCTLTSLRTFLVLGLAMVLKGEKQTFKTYKQAALQENQLMQRHCNTQLQRNPTALRGSYGATLLLTAGSTGATARRHLSSTLLRETCSSPCAPRPEATRS